MTIYGPSWPLSNGERDFFKMYTTRLEQIKFEMNRTEDIDNIISNISSQISTYLPNVAVESINAIRDATNIDSGLLGIKISFRAPRTNNLETIDISLYGSEQEIY